MPKERVIHVCGGCKRQLPCPCGTKVKSYGNDPTNNVFSAIGAGLGFQTPTAQAIAGEMLDHPEGRHVLSGHSYGGMAAAQAATKHGLATAEYSRQNPPRAPSPGEDGFAGYSAYSKSATAYSRGVAETERRNSEHYNKILSNTSVNTYGSPEMHTEAKTYKQTSTPRDPVTRLPTTGSWNRLGRSDAAREVPRSAPGKIPLLSDHKYENYESQARQDMRDDVGGPSDRPTFVHVAGGVASHWGRDAEERAATFRSDIQTYAQPEPPQYIPPPTQYYSSAPPSSQYPSAPPLAPPRQHPSGATVVSADPRPLSSQFASVPFGTLQPPPRRDTSPPGYLTQRVAQQSSTSMTYTCDTCGKSVRGTRGETPKHWKRTPSGRYFCGSKCHSNRR